MAALRRYCCIASHRLAHDRNGGSLELTAQYRKAVPPREARKLPTGCSLKTGSAFCVDSEADASPSCHPHHDFDNHRCSPQRREMTAERLPAFVGQVMEAGRTSDEVAQEVQSRGAPYADRDRHIRELDGLRHRYRLARRSRTLSLRSDQQSHTK